jgi:hypothetical protein
MKYLATLSLIFMFCFWGVHECNAAFPIRNTDNNVAGSKRVARFERRVNKLGLVYEKRLKNNFPRHTRKFDWDRVAITSFLYLLLDLGLIGLGYLILISTSNFAIGILGLLLMGSGIGGLAYASVLAMIGLVRKNTEKKWFAVATLVAVGLIAFIYFVINKGTLPFP